MARFIEGRQTTTPLVDDDLLELTPATLRSMIPGDFFLIPNPISQGRVLSELTNCILMLHEKGLFVFDKQIQFGQIYGDAFSKFWESVNIFGDKVKFPSPYIGNQRNIRFYSSILKLPEDRFHSMIVFNTECDVRKAPKGKNLTVLHIEQLEEHFAKLLPTLPVQYTHAQLEALHDIFLLKL